MPLKFIGANGQGTADDAVRAILYATRMGAVVSNNSWGGEEFSQALEDAIADADAHGSLFVAAAGNSARDTDATPDYPSGFDLPNVLTVGATDQNDVRAWFSNYGKRLGRPRRARHEHLLDLARRLYRFLDGTSMAAPHVTGVAALAKAAFPSASAVGLKTLLLLRTVDPNASFAGLSSTGGRLNARSAVTCWSGAQVWIESPAAGFEVDVGKPVSVTVLGAACGDPGRRSGRARTANGSPVALTPRGDGLYTGSFAPTVARPGGARRDGYGQRSVGHALRLGLCHGSAAHRPRRRSGESHRREPRRQGAAHLRRGRRRAREPRAQRRHDRHLVLLLRIPLRSPARTEPPSWRLRASARGADSSIRGRCRRRVLTASSSIPRATRSGRSR